MAKPKLRETLDKNTELPSNMCIGNEKCGGRKHWVESLESAYRKVPRADGGVDMIPLLWFCPVARGAAESLPPSKKEIVKAEIKQADRQADREIRDQKLTVKWGPLRKVTERLGGGAETTERVRLECGHERAATKGVPEVRCMKCRPKTSG